MASSLVEPRFLNSTNYALLVVPATESATFLMVIDFAFEAQRRQRARPEDTIYAASVLRFRPIMMTTLAVLLAALPLASGTGNGAEVPQPLAISIVGGLIVSKVLTLYTTPMTYLYLRRLAR